MLVSHLYCQRDGLQRTYLITGSYLARIVLLSDPFHIASEIARTTAAVRAFQNGQSGHTSQHLRIVLRDICCNLDALSADLAGHERQHELFWAHLRCSGTWRVGVLVHTCKEDVPIADHTVPMSKSVKNIPN